VAGVVGKLSFDPRESLARPALDQMLAALILRGTESRSLFVAPGIALGVCSDRDDMPDAAQSTPAVGSIRVVADSALANADSLRRELRELGFPCRDDRDGTLIARAFEAWGERCFEKLDGPFACAIWDERRRRLLLARDHAGIRALYFALLHGRGVVFASTLKALFQDPGVTRERCATGIDAYLALGYVPAPLTAFRRVSKLEPAQYVVIEGRRLHTGQYWTSPTTHFGVSADEAAEQLETRLRGALRAHAGTPVLFSGGVASGVLLCADHNRTAITIAIDQTSADVARAHAVAVHLGHTPEVDVAAVDVATLARDVAASFDEPIADPGSVTQYAICATASAYGAAALTGHGASALFEVAAQEAVWDDRRRKGLYTPSFAWEVRDSGPDRHHASPVSRLRSRVVDPWLSMRARSLLPDSTLVVARRAALAAGLTLHFPFASRDMLAFAATLPASLTRGGGSTSLLQHLIHRRVPGLPRTPAGPQRVPQWLHAALATLVPSVLLAHRFHARGIVSRLALQSLWDEHRRGRCDHSRGLWSLLMLELWFRQLVDGDGVAEPAHLAMLKVA
jgi:asparagine synthase (glutamine-hydrolysing)